MFQNFTLQNDKVVTIKNKVRRNSTSNSSNGSHYLNFGEEDEMDIEGFAVSKLRSRISQVLCIASLGLLRLFFHWFPYLHLLASHKKCSLRSADKVVITDNYHKNKTYFIKKVKVLESNDNFNEGKNLLKFRICNGRTKDSRKIRIINCKKLTYVWDEEKNNFLKLSGLENGITTSELHKYEGLSKEDQLSQKIVYGPNEIIIPVQTVWELIILEALTPFYIFQLFSLIVWLCEAYYYYGIAIVIMSVFGISSSIIQTRKNQQNLKGTIHTSDKVTICRKDGSHEEISTSALVPGDIIVIPRYGCDMHCDAVLLNGSCVVNESMLTGESVPVTKTPLPSNELLYSVKNDANHTLFCGTRVIQTRCHETDILKAVVIRTGYLTTKGELVRSILYPPPTDFKFDQDSYKYIIILSCIAGLGFLYTIVSKVSRNIPPLETIFKALDIFTIVIPPALPAAMTVGKMYALNRLKNRNIYCINSRVINVSGSVDCVCFDKTGTLTEDELDLWAVVPISNGKTQRLVKNLAELPTESSLFRAMTSCHTLTLINEEVCGDPLDLKMFSSTKWIIEESSSSYRLQGTYGSLKPLLILKSTSNTKDGSDELAIIKQFQFSSSLQRMSVICKSPKNQFLEVFCKGSPEKIISLSNENSVPKDIHHKIREFTEQGYRVIGMGTKILENSEDSVKKIDRKDVEKDLDFIGLIILENKLKSQSIKVIKELKEAEMKVVMITGDNIQTAITVAKECKIVDENAKVVEIEIMESPKEGFAEINYRISLDNQKHETKLGNSLDIEQAQDINYCFAITGQNWIFLNKYFPTFVPQVVAKGAVFARMSGLQKQELVEALKNLGYYVAMCGDGSNDCSALKAAHVGISLSEAEASIASPFTSKDANISCTPEVIKEGRGALVTSFGVFKIMLCYSLTEFTSTVILYTIDSNLSSVEFLYIDVVLILNFMFWFGRTRAYKKLAKEAPQPSILSFVPLCSIGFFMLVSIGFQIFAFWYVQTFKWFKPFEYDLNLDVYTGNVESYEGYSVFCVSMFQYITMSVVFSRGKPYRKPIYTNKIYMISLLLTTCLCGYIALIPSSSVISFFQLMIPPSLLDRTFILWISVINFSVCLIVEDFIVQIVLEKFVAPKVRRSKKLYLEILHGLKVENNWPKVQNDLEYTLTNISEIKVNGIVNKGYVNSEYNTKL